MAAAATAAATAADKKEVQVFLTRLRRLFTDLGHEHLHFSKSGKFVVIPSWKSVEERLQELSKGKPPKEMMTLYRSLSKQLTTYGFLAVEPRSVPVSEMDITVTRYTRVWFNPQFYEGMEENRWSSMARKQVRKGSKPSFNERAKSITYSDAVSMMALIPVAENAEHQPESTEETPTADSSSSSNSVTQARSPLLPDDLSMISQSPVDDLTALLPLTFPSLSPRLPVLAPIPLTASTQPLRYDYSDSLLSPLDISWFQLAGSAYTSSPSNLLTPPLDQPRTDPDFFNILTPISRLTRSNLRLSSAARNPTSHFKPYHIPSQQDNNSIPIFNQPIDTILGDWKQPLYPSANASTLNLITPAPAPAPAPTPTPTSASISSDPFASHLLSSIALPR